MEAQRERFDQFAAELAAFGGSRSRRIMTNQVESRLVALRLVWSAKGRMRAKRREIQREREKEKEKEREGQKKREGKGTKLT